MKSSLLSSMVHSMSDEQISDVISAWLDGLGETHYVLCDEETYELIFKGIETNKVKVTSCIPDGDIYIIDREPPTAFVRKIRV